MAYITSTRLSWIFIELDDDDTRRFGGGSFPFSVSKNACAKEHKSLLSPASLLPESLLSPASLLLEIDLFSSSIGMCASVLDGLDIEVLLEVLSLACISPLF